MLNRLAVIMVNTLAAVLVFVAQTGVSPNCWWITYEPDIPEGLKHGD
ncbi:hypothetical protein Psch_02832 [Pelotomaculum schinkii]|uniref:Cyclic lactone autoinducer peptide n=1 Tax=Pelotomaculum schinkii TaxID=78350 RepID=A0A4Y7RAT3_9FIRM|nr:MULTISPECIES: cyclic lactone autoinducer peptide [Pelotomaculum]TEB05791.1 hypothetical protein Psch_02832 [Pelotomaculum schinkii]TEB17958.1 hypothetical protein Psfp_00081 [Pelotomaculum sp. FP]